MKLRIYIETYGCALNRGDSAVMKSILLEKGFEVVDRIEDADVVVINTCIVRGDTEQRMIKRIRELAKLGKKLIVAGCMARVEPFTIKSIAPKAVLVSPQNVHRIVEAVLAPEGSEFIEGTKSTEYVPTVVEGVRATIPVGEGCTDTCAFCVVRFARPYLRSIPIDRVVRAVRDLVKRGAVEIEITAQDLGAYGIDIAGRPLLPELLRSILEIEDFFMLRIGQLNPNHLAKFVDEIAEIMKDPRVYKYIHVPVQSGSNKVLKYMKRSHTVEDFVELVKYLRSKIVGIQIATDIIVGHPGEEEEDFAKTVELLTTWEIDRVHIARYSPRPFTESASMPQIPDAVKKNRSRYLEKVYESVGYRLNTEYIGAKAIAIATEIGLREGTLVARLYNYRPVVIRVDDPKKYLGKKLLVEIVDATFYDLRAELLRVLD